jgi:radical SAM protein with 4Fe4S-binding SPASM domain
MNKVLTPQFERVNVEIVNTCNLKCSFCPTPERPEKAMTPQQFSRVASSLAGRTKEIVLHLLGEPLSHPDLEGVLGEAHKIGVPINIVTNGLLLVGAKIDVVLKPIVRQISISLQSFADNFPDQNSDAYIRRIRLFCDQAFEDRPDLYVNLRFWDLTLGAEDGTSSIRESEASKRLRESLAEAFEFDWQSVRVDLRRKKNHRLRGRQYLHFDSRFTWPSLTGDVLQETGFCHALSGHVGVHSDGTVVPCCLDHNADIPLGNIFAQPIDDILSSNRAVKMKDGFRNRTLVEDLCRRCGFINRFG